MTTLNLDSNEETMLCKVDQLHSVSRKTIIIQVSGDQSQDWKTIVISRVGGKIAHNLFGTQKEIISHIQFHSAHC